MTDELPNKSSILPEGWEWVEMNELCEKITDGTHFTPTYIDAGTPFISVKDIRDNKINFENCKYIPEDEHNKLIKRCHPQVGDVLITKSGTIGRTAVVKTNKPFSLFVSVALLKPYKKYLNSNFIEHSLINFINGIDVKQSVKGGVIKNLHIEDLRKIKIPLPPIAQQNRLVEKLDELFTRLDAGIESLKQVKTLLKKYRQSVLKSAVEGKLTSEWRKQHKDELEPGDKLLERILKERKEKWEAEQLANYKAKGIKPPKDWKDKYKEPSPPDTSKLPELPDGWVWSNVNQSADIVSGQTPKGIKEISNTGNIPWYKVGDMNKVGNEKYLHNANFSLTENEIRALKLKIYPKGTITFPKRGGAILTNKKRILSKPSCFDLNTMGIIPHELIAEYFWYWFKGLFLGSLSDGSNVPQINNTNISPLVFPMPPTKEQSIIVKEVEKLFSIIDESSKLVDSELKRSQSLRQSILKQAFEGKLVPQDSNDEPASVLLERIKAEKATLKN